MPLKLEPTIVPLALILPEAVICPLPLRVRDPVIAESPSLSPVEKNVCDSFPEAPAGPVGPVNPTVEIVTTLSDVGVMVVDVPVLLSTIVSF